MACGYVCTNCGKCRSEKRAIFEPGICLSCGFANSPDAVVCASCGALLLQPPGQSQGTKMARVPVDAR